MIKIGLTDFTPADKIIEIRDKNQIIKAKYAISATDILKHTLMSEHYIEISFLYNKNIAFKRSDYILWNGEKFTLREDYIPKQENKYKYQYTLKFEATEMLFQDIQFYYLNQNLKESEWRLAGNAEYFIKIAVDNANRYFGVTDFKVGVVEPAEVKDIIFDTNTNTFDALIQIAESYEAEWYMTGKTINLVKKVSFGAEVDFETEVSVLSMSRSEGENSKKYTRILALGSERNLPKDYRGSSTGEGVDAVYPKRLRIPAAKGDVIDAYPNMSPEEVVEGTVIFDEVYPKRVGTIGAVGTIEYTDTDEDTGEVTKWNAFKIKDPGINFKEEYVLPGEELRLIFQSGDLNGFDFALKFHKDGFSKTDNSQYFEIVRSEDYGKKMPNDTMKPKAGDKYVLYGFNIALVSDQYVPAGEQELFDTASAWLQKQLQDTSVYDCPTVIDYFKRNEMDLEIGQKVKLVNDLFAAGVRSSRIMGYEKKLYNKYDATYTVGDNSAYNRLTAIEKDIKELQYAGVVYESSGSGGVYLIKQFDTTTPSDHNAYSAKASDAKYFNKQTGGAVQGDTLFQKNIQVQGTAISDVFQNSTFTAGQLGSGFQIKRDANGQSYMEIDNLMVRRETVFNRLTIAEIKSVGGTILLSLANMVISKVDDKTSAWRCYFDNANGTIPNDFAVSDQVICRKYTGKNIKYYWSKVTSVGVDFIEISKTDKDGSGVPAIADEVIQLGNRNDVNRQYAIMLSAYGSDAPSIKQYAGINSYDMTGKEVTTISPKGNKFTGSFTVSTNGTTAPVYKERQIFANGTVYYLNDRVSHLGSYWVCIVESTITTPSETSLAWRKDTAGQTDINNAVNNIDLGSRNLILNTKNERSVTKPTTGFGQLIYYYTDYLKNYSADDVYTLSFEAKPLEDEKYPFASIVIGSRTPTGDAWSLRIYTDSLEKQVLSDGYIRYKGNVKFNVSAGMRWAVGVIFIIEGNAVGGTFRKVIFNRGNKAADWSVAPEEVESDINKAQATADQAKTDATNAQSSANTANNLLADIASDNKLTPNEKQETQKEWDVIVSEYPKNISQANKFNVSTGAYISAYNALNTYTASLLSDLGTTSDIKGDDFRAIFKTYYDARTDLLNTISVKAKELADNAQLAADNAQLEAEKVRTEYKADFVVLDTKIASKVSQTDFDALGQRVSNTESSITQQAGQITSVVETVNNISIGTRNLALSSKGSFSATSYKLIKTLRLSSPLVIGETYIVTWKNIKTKGNLGVFFDMSGVSVNRQSISRGKTFVANREYPYLTFFAEQASEIDLEIAEIKVEKGNKATEWSPAPEDVQSGIDNAQSSANNAQNTADSKNRSYYQDIAPSVPSGGHKVGDLWYKTSLVDSSGVINADPSKNIYQLQYRWDGSAWIQVNWSVAKSKIEQTDSSISLIVEKTGVNSVGTGSSLFSMIQQTENKITLEVSKIQVGGRNLALNSKGSFGMISYGLIRTLRLSSPLVIGETYIVTWKNIKTKGNLGVFFDMSGVSVNRQSISRGKTFVANREYPYLTFFAEQSSEIDLEIAEIKVEKGNKATEWSPAPEDTQAGIDKAQNTADSKTTLDEVSSSLTLTDNKISLASKTIELKGTTIAKAIEAEDLKVGSRDKGACLEVSVDKSDSQKGYFYVKGSSGTNSSLVIDSGNQSIEITSPYSSTGNPSGGTPGSSSGKSTVSITSQSGGVRVSNDNYDISIVSTSGIFANNAGQGMYPASAVDYSKAAIVGLGNGSVAPGIYGNSFVAGVYGRASNSSSGEAYGGYFDILRANGFVMSMIDISDGVTPSDQYTSLTKGTSFVLGNSTVMQTVYLPNDAPKGTVIWLKQWWTGYMRIRPRGTQRLFDDSSQNDYIDVREGWTAMCVFVGNWGTGSVKYGTWMISKFKF